MAEAGTSGARGRRPGALGGLVALLLVSAGAFAFLSLAGEVQAGDTRAWDRAVLDALRPPGQPVEPVGPAWLEEAAEEVTALGGVTIVVGVTAAVAGFLLLAGRGRLALLVLLAVGGGLILSFGLKEVYQRARPELGPGLEAVHTYAFPSGHSFLSATVYLTLGALVAWSNPRRRVQVYALTVAIVLTVAVGLTRVYLGVHWPTDVLAGWVLGAAWALGCVTAARWLGARGTLSRRGGG